MSRNTNVQSRNRALNGPVERRWPQSGVIVSCPEYNDLRPGQRKVPDEIIVLD